MKILSRLQKKTCYFKLIKNMEIKDSVRFIILKINSYDYSNIVFVKILTDNSVENVKINSSLAKFKYQHLLKPNYILFGTLIKTRKNWILLEITSFSPLAILTSFKDYEKYATLLNVIQGYLYENQDVETCLTVLIDYFTQKPLESIVLEDFEQMLLTNFGFTNSGKANYAKEKNANHLN